MILATFAFAEIVAGIVLNMEVVGGASGFPVTTHTELGVLLPVTVLVILFGYSEIFFELNLVFYAGIAYLMNLLSWLIVCLKFRHNLLFGFLNPIATFLMIIVAMHSIFSYCLKITTWKGRNIIGFKLRL